MERAHLERLVRRQARARLGAEHLRAWAVGAAVRLGAIPGRAAGWQERRRRGLRPADERQQLLALLDGTDTDLAGQLLAVVAALEQQPRRAVHPLLERRRAELLVSPVHQSQAQP